MASVRPQPQHSVVRAISITAVVGLALVTLSGCSSLGDSVQLAFSSAMVRDAGGLNDTNLDSSSVDAAELLSLLPVRGQDVGTDFSITQFETYGDSDFDGDGCDTADDLLSRDLVNIVFSASDSCKIDSGTLYDEYSGDITSYSQGDLATGNVRVDYVVSLQNAWMTGAKQLSTTDRARLANDPLNMQLVAGDTERTKDSGDAGKWLPPLQSYQCIYVARQISVKAAYHLWVTPQEVAAMSQVLAACPDQHSYVSEYKDEIGSPFTAQPQASPSS